MVDGEILIYSDSCLSESWSWSVEDIWGYDYVIYYIVWWVLVLVYFLSYVEVSFKEGEEEIIDG